MRRVTEISRKAAKRDAKAQKTWRLCVSLRVFA
jgi:hypothetical protein